ncbi:expressed unknown protein [Seminavis robusta]|uniref:Uncharacterized protein n=1 Tax=Seminavis robusta TaxID=568900 RepID=A0A9N8DVB8_9STRA|nr:expressed unknown protein [Seminavis robusta]|eukprot:Sro398_g134730.1 n/a (398) ;mRNA; f:51507-52829
MKVMKRLFSRLRRRSGAKNTRVSHDDETDLLQGVVGESLLLTNAFFVGPPVSLTDLLDALREGCIMTPCTNIQVERSFLDCLSVTEQFLFWNVLGKSRQIKRVSLVGIDPLPTHVLATLLQSPILVELELSHVRLVGDLKVLRGDALASLCTIHLWNVDVATTSGTTASQPQQNDFVKLIMNLPQLHELALGDGFAFDGPQITAICNALSRPCHPLKSLRLMGASSNHNNHYFSHGYHVTQALDDQASVALATMLQTNRSLQSLELSNLQIGLVPLANALRQDNRTLCQFHVFQVHLFCRQDTTVEETNALVEMLRDNPVLTSCLLPTCSTRSEMDFYLQLNRHGLRDIQVDVNRSRYTVVELLAAENDNNVNNNGNKLSLDCIYHVLRDNPTLMNV